jgi:hypothetical protein
MYECRIRNAGYLRTEVIFMDNSTYWFSIDQCRFENNVPADYVIRMQEIFTGQLTDNDFEYNTSGAVYLPATSAGILNIQGNTATGNLVNGLSLDCSYVVTSHGDWMADLPYVLEHGSGGQLTVEADAGIALIPGTVVKFNSCPGIHLLGGLLNAQGTPVNHIVFTSFADDMNGGDTNGDGGESIPMPGDWDGIYLESGGFAHLDFCDVYYAGGGTTGTLGFTNSSHAAVSNSRFCNNETNNSPVISLSYSGGGGRSSDNSVCSMVNTLIADNSGEGEAVVVDGDQDTLIMFSCLLDNNDAGVVLLDGSHFDIHHCDFLNLPYVALQNNSGEYVNAEFNWWNDPSGPSGVGPGTGSEIMGDSVNFVPWKPFGGNDGGGAAVDTSNTEIQGPNNEFNDPTEGLGSPDDRWVSIGVNGFVTLDFGEVIEVGEGPEFTIFESDTESVSRQGNNLEGFDILSSEDGSGFNWVDRGTGTETIDMGQARQDGFRYLKVVDDGDGDPNTYSPGYDLDAIYTEYPLPMTKVWVNDSIFPFDDDSANFGDVEVSDTAYTQIVVYNLGSDTLELSDASLSVGQGFFLELSRFPESIVYGAPYVFQVGFNPNQANAYEDQLYIATDDAWDDTVVVHLFGQGVPVGIAENSRGVPNSDFLRLEGPLPCGDMLSLTYGLWEAASVQISLYNVLGQRVDVVLQGYRQAGLHRLTYRFDEDMAGGTYFLEMDAGRDRQVRKIVVR